MKARHIKMALIIVVALLGLTALGSDNSGVLDKIRNFLCSDTSINLSLCEPDQAQPGIDANSKSNSSQPVSAPNQSREVWQAIMPDRKDSGLRVYFLDVGQGDSTLIQTPAGETILIDAGNNDKGDEVVEYLTHLGVIQIDVMVATHPDADHIGGLDTVLEAFDVKSVYAPKVSHTTNTYKDFLSAVQNEKLKIKTAEAGVEIKLEDVQAVFIAPASEYKETELNEWSAALRLTYKDTSFLFTGDAEAISEKDMLASGAILATDVLKVGHHGASTSSSKAFLARVKPAYAVISSAYGNSYGHPTQDVLDRLSDVGAVTYRTDLQGTITAVSDGKRIEFTKAMR